MKRIKSYTLGWNTVQKAVSYTHLDVYKRQVIKGDTPHFDYVCDSVTQGITLLNLQINAPTIFGVLTVNNKQQALERIGGIHGHKGEEAAITALKMIDLNNRFIQ